MKNFIRVLTAEVIKQHRNTFYSRFIYFSLLIWPIITFINTYFMYKPFNLNLSAWNELNSPNSILLFLMTGYMGYICFWSLVESALKMGQERINGTLETIFLSPANRLAIIYGRSLGALLESVWMFLIFIVVMIMVVPELPLKNLVYAPLALLVLLVTATVWGGLMNVIFLFSRDANIVFTIFDEPMTLFSGVRIPPSVFPLWAKMLSVIFPLSHSLAIVRSLLIAGDRASITSPLIGMFFSVTVLILMTVWLLKKAEKNARIKGSFTFY